MAPEFFRIAIEEFYSEHYKNNSWTLIIQRYWNIINENFSDPRVKNLPLMDNPLATISIILTYLTFVLVAGPYYMRDRKPMKLKNTLIYYNAFQVALSAYMFYEHLMAGWWNDYSFSCQPIDYSDSPKPKRMVILCYLYYISKFTELADTTFFILRKKQSQVTFLHVYHHSVTPLETWFLVKFLAGGNATFQNLLNNFVHIIMYFYYLLAAYGPKYQKYLWWKKYMTELQIVQFIFCIIHAVQALCTNCKFPYIVTYLLLMNSLVFIVLFTNFYIKSFKTDKQTQTIQNNTQNVQNVQCQIVKKIN